MSITVTKAEINMDSLVFFIGQLTVENFLLKSQVKQLQDTITSLQTQGQCLTGGPGSGTFATQKP